MSDLAPTRVPLPGGQKIEAKELRVMQRTQDELTAERSIVTAVRSLCDNHRACQYVRRQVLS
jgi:hypothetical protein